MHIEEIKLGQLEEFIQSERFRKFNELPITSLRAYSQLKNPRAGKDDVVLIVAYDDNFTLLGYVGALPDLLLGKHKVAWNSCWYANSTLGKSIALPLFLQFFKIWNGQIIMQGLTSKTRKIISSLSIFTTIKEIIGLRLFFRFYFYDLFATKYSHIKKYFPLLKPIDSVLNTLFFPITQLWKLTHRISKNFQIIESDHINDEVDNFILLMNQNELTGRTKKEIDWIVNNPWISDRKITESVEERPYFFSQKAESFSYRMLKIFRNNELIAFTILRERNKHYEVSYIYFNLDISKTMRSILVNYLIEKKAKSLAVFNPRLSFVQHRFQFPIYYQRKIYRELVVSTNLAKNIPEYFEIQDGDGDVAFT